MLITDQKTQAATAEQQPEKARPVTKNTQINPAEQQYKGLETLTIAEDSGSVTAEEQPEKAELVTMNTQLNLAD